MNLIAPLLAELLETVDRFSTRCQSECRSATAGMEEHEAERRTLVRFSELARPHLSKARELTEVGLKTLQQISPHSIRDEFIFLERLAWGLDTVAHKAIKEFKASVREAKALSNRRGHYGGQLKIDNRPPIDPTAVLKKITRMEEILDQLEGWRKAR